METEALTKKEFQYLQNAEKQNVIIEKLEDRDKKRMEEIQSLKAENKSLALGKDDGRQFAELKAENEKLKLELSAKKETDVSSAPTAKEEGKKVCYRKERMELMDKIFGREKKTLVENEKRTSDGWRNWFEVEVLDTDEDKIKTLIASGYSLKL